MHLYTPKLTFEEKINVIAQAIENNRNITMREMVGFGSPAQFRRERRFQYVGKLQMEIRREVQPNIFAQFGKNQS